MKSGLTRAEVEQLLAWADSWVSEPADRRTQAARIQAVQFVRLLLLTGMRIGEGLALEWRDVDPDAGTLFVRRSKTKRGVRTVGVPGPLKSILATRADAASEGGFVFGAPNRPEVAWDATNCRRLLQRIFEGPDIAG